LLSKNYRHVSKVDCRMMYLALLTYLISCTDIVWHCNETFFRRICLRKN